ncbi:MAG: DegV family protein [Candidatus Pacebacteria bacterium]|nr:DegV family protein [Candidatus Paceibacterota bacterium]
METIKEEIGIVVDETADLPEETIKENKIGIVKFKLDFQDLIDIPGNVYQKVREGEKRGIKNLIKTSQPSINDFFVVFKEKLKEAENILCVTLSSKVSGAYNSALQAKKFLGAEFENKVHIFDSMNGSGSEGLVVLKAVALIRQKIKLDEVVEKLKKELPNIKLIGMYKSPKWLEASGRIPKFVPVLMGQAEKINVRPVLGLRDGKLTFVGIKRNLKDISSALFEEFEKATRGAREAERKVIVAITHADSIEEANKLKDMVLGLKNTEIAFINLVCFPVGGHIGPDTIVLSWNQ